MQKQRIGFLVLAMAAFLIVLLVFIEAGTFKRTHYMHHIACSSENLEMGGGELDGPVPTPSPKPEPDSTPEPENNDNNQNGQKEVIIKELV